MSKEKKTLKDLLDINGDGKLNAEDIKQGFVNMLDIDGDGKIEVLEVITRIKELASFF